MMKDCSKQRKWYHVHLESGKDLEELQEGLDWSLMSKGNMVLEEVREEGRGQAM